MSRLVALAACAISTGLLACPSTVRQASVEPPTGWHEAATPHFTLIGDVPPAMLRDLAADLAMFHALVERVTTAQLSTPRVPVRIYLFAKRQHALPYLPGQWVAGVMMPRAQGYYSVIDGHWGAAETRQVLFHEYSHYILRSQRRVDYPRWYDEGLSDFLSTAYRRGDAIIVGQVPSARVATLSSLRPYAPEELFGGSPVGKSAPRFYASSWALVHFLNTSEDGRERLTRYVERLVRGEEWRAAYAASFDQGLDSLRDGLEAHIAQLRVGGQRDYYMRASALSPAPVGPLAPIAPAETAYRLGALARIEAEIVADSEAARFHRTARANFERAVALDAFHARARAALAWSLARDADWDEAEAQLARAAREAPSDAEIALETGRIRSLRARARDAGSAELEVARAALSRAAELLPDRPEPHAELATLLAFLEEPRAAIVAFEKARAVGAWSPIHDLEQARQYVKTGQFGPAAALLAPIASDPHGGEMSEAAADLLEEIRSQADERDGSPSDTRR